MDNLISLLVIDSDEEYCKNITVCAKSHPSFLDAVYTTDANEGLRLLTTMKPTALIISFLLPGLDAIGILRRITQSELTTKPFIIVASQAMTPAMLTAATEYGADYFVIKPQPAAELCNTMSDLLSATHTDKLSVSKTDDSIDIKITRFLHCMGIPANLNGYDYIRSSLRLTINDISVLSPITQRLYPELARKYNKTPQSIERSIRHAIKISWERGNKKILHDIFGFTPDNTYQGYPTNSEYIAMLADDLRLRIKHNISI